MHAYGCTGVCDEWMRLFCKQDVVYWDRVPPNSLLSNELHDYHFVTHNVHANDFINKLSGEPLKIGDPSHTFKRWLKNYNICMTSEAA